MHDFFKGRRRKVGCGLLVMACVVTGLWVRSYFICDQIAFPHNDCQWNIFSADGSLLAFAVRLGPLEDGHAAWWSGENHRDDPSTPQITLMVHKIRRANWKFEYGLFVLPITLLAACLILWKPGGNSDRHKAR